MKKYIIILSLIIALFTCLLFFTFHKVQTDFSNFSEQLQQLSVRVNEQKNIKGKRILLIGDSVSDTLLYPNCWVTNFEKMLMESGAILTNNSLQGRCISTIENISNNLENVLPTITGDYDHIIVFLGVNDYFNQGCLGETNTGTWSTVCGALLEFDKWKRNNYPNANVTFITPLKSEKADWAGHKLLQFYVMAIASSAECFGYQVIDAHGSAPLRAPLVSDLFTLDGIHPTEDYSKFLADYIYNNFISEVSSITTNANTYLTIGDAGGSSNRVFANIDFNGNLNICINDYMLIGNGEPIKIADLLDEYYPKYPLMGQGVVVQADNSHVPVLFFQENDSIFCDCPKGIQGQLFGYCYSNAIKYGMTCDYSY